MVAEAVTFFTGSVAKFDQRGNRAATVAVGITSMPMVTTRPSVPKPRECG
jgi:hypothetical protein